MFNFTEVQTILQMLGETLAVSATLGVGVLAGYAIFKLATLASFIYFGRYIVTKIYELIKLQLERPAVYELTCGGETITRSGQKSEVRALALAIEQCLDEHSHGFAIGTEIKEVTAYIKKYHEVKNKD